MSENRSTEASGAKERLVTKELANGFVGDEIRGLKYPVHDHGFVALLDWMGDDQAIVDAARTSYGAGTTHTSDTRTLLRYLMRHRHTTPIEMCEVKLLVQVPMDCWRQWIRHRTATVNEYSTRYSEAIDDRYCAPDGLWRAQATDNKQGSAGYVTEWPDGYTPQEDGSVAFDSAKVSDTECGGFTQPHLVGPAMFLENRVADRKPTPGEYLSSRECDVHEATEGAYKERLRFGVAREVARKDLPLSTYTRAVWKIDLHNLFNFLSLRMDSHAQQEIRMYADTIGYKIVSQLFPQAFQAFLDYRLNAVSLTAMDQKVIRSLMLAGERLPVSVSLFKQHLPRDWQNKPRCRERAECLDKLLKLGIFREESRS